MRRMVNQAHFIEGFNLHFLIPNSTCHNVEGGEVALCPALELHGETILCAGPGKQIGFKHLNKKGTITDIHKLKKKLKKMECIPFVK